MDNNSTENRFYFFLDESGDHGLSFVDQNFPLFLLVGCLFKNTELLLNPKEPYIPFQIIKNKLYCDRNGKYDGYGLKVFP